MSETVTHTHAEHFDADASKIGMWLFIFTELLLFGGLFVVYSIMRFTHQNAFHLAAQELNVFLGATNTVLLLTSSMTIAMAVSAVQYGHKKFTLLLIGITILLGLIFLVNKYFEWKVKFQHGLYPGSEVLHGFGYGDTIFFGLYFFMTGLHALHIIVGVTILGWIMARVSKDKIHAEKYVHLENGALYWHLVDVIWIFLFPLFYLIT
jgi:cytochrome c oxidase subunit III